MKKSLLTGLFIGFFVSLSMAATYTTLRTTATSFTIGQVLYASGVGVEPTLSSDLVWSNGLSINRTSAATQLDELTFARSGTQKGRIGIDSLDRFRLSGPNLSSNSVTIEANDFVQIGPAVASPSTRLRVTDDAGITGSLRVGDEATFGAAAVDPDGSIHLGRLDTGALARTFLRIFLGGTEKGRIGLDSANNLTLMAGANDSPSVTINSFVMELTGVTGAGLPASPNGSLTYCTNCNAATSPCTTGGSGAIAIRQGSAWKCL